MSLTLLAAADNCPSVFSLEEPSFILLSTSQSHGSAWKGTHQLQVGLMSPGTFASDCCRYMTEVEKNKTLQVANTFVFTQSFSLQGKLHHGNVPILQVHCGRWALLFLGNALCYNIYPLFSTNLSSENQSVNNRVGVGVTI